MCCVGCSQLVDIPTRFSNDNKCKPSLLDHTYTNINKHSTKSGVCLFDISDHLPVFLILNNVKLTTQTKIKFIRCMKKFNLDEFLIDLKLQLEGSNFESLVSSVNDDVQPLSATFKCNRQACAITYNVQKGIAIKQKTLDYKGYPRIH